MKLNLGNQIRINRRRMNLTQEQLAEKFGTSPQAISRWEIGATYPDIEMLPMIASFFEMSVDALLGVTEEEKEKFCAELQQSFETAVRAKDVHKTIDIMREIRRNLKEYQHYWFWGLYTEIWKVRLFRDEKVLEEMRLLAEEIFSVCPKDDHWAVIDCMSYMEDDEHIDTFLDAYASREDMARSTLLFNRYTDTTSPINTLATPCTILLALSKICGNSTRSTSIACSSSATGGRRGAIRILESLGSRP